MFCGKCGAKNMEYAEFCAGCGARLNKSQLGMNCVSPAESNSNDKNRKVGMIVVALLAVMLISVAVFAFGGRSYKATMKKFFDATFEADAETIVKLIPEELLDYMLEEEGSDIDEFIDELNEDLQEQIDSLDEYLGDWTVSYEILNVEDMRKSELEDLKEQYEEADVKVSDAKTIEIELIVQGEDTENSNTMEIAVIKVGRSWYLDAESMGSLF